MSTELKVEAKWYTDRKEDMWAAVLKSKRERETKIFIVTYLLYLWVDPNFFNDITIT